MKLGIAICTYNRIDTLMQTIHKVRLHTKSDYELVVVDDGSADGTSERLTNVGIKVISSRNRGIAWNKNRALYYLKAIVKAEAIIIIEDDTFPLEDNWEVDWIRAIARWGHINLAARYWENPSFRDGTGTPERPYKSEHVSAQCTGFLSECIENVGYMDSRFRGWGMEHVEHTTRFVRAGYGGELITPIHRPVYYLIDSNMEILHREESVGVDDLRKQKLIAESMEICLQISTEKNRRDPWINDEEMVIFLSEFNPHSNRQLYFYLKDSADKFMVRDEVSGTVTFVDQASFATTPLQKVISHYDGKVMRLCVVSRNNLRYISIARTGNRFDLVKDPSLSLQLDVVLDRNSGMFLRNQGVYLSCDRSNGDTAAMDRPEPNDWERFYFSHFKTIRRALYPSFS